MESTTTTLLPPASPVSNRRPITKSSLVWLIIRHDFRRLWPHAVVCLAAAVVGYMIGTRPGPLGPKHFWASVMLQFGVMPYWILLGSLFPAIIQSDAPIGTSGFLMTRPISSSYLLIAKLVQVAGMFVVVPLVIQAASLAILGYNGAQIGDSCEGLFVGLLLAMVWGSFLASVTRDLFQYWLLIVSILIAAIVWFEWMPSLPSAATRDLEATQGELNQSVIAVGLLALMFWQHRHRKPICAIVAALILVFSASQLTSYWPWTFPWLREVKAPVEVLPWPYTVVKGPLFLSDSKHTRLLLTTEMTPPPGSVVRFEELEGKVQWSRNTEHWETKPADLESAELGCRAFVQATLGIDFNVTAPSESLDRRLDIILGQRPSDDRTPSFFRGRVRGNRIKFSLLGQIPLRSGARLSKDGHTVVLLDVPQPSNDVHLSIWQRGLGTYAGRLEEDLHLVLVNTSRKEAHILGRPTLYGNSSNFVPGVAIRTGQWSLGPGYENHHEDFLSPAWLAGAELAVFIERVGSPVTLDLSCSIPSDYFPPLLNPAEKEKAKKAAVQKMSERIQSLDSSPNPVGLGTSPSSH